MHSLWLFYGLVQRNLRASVDIAILLSFSTFSTTSVPCRYDSSWNTDDSIGLHVRGLPNLSIPMDSAPLLSSDARAIPELECAQPCLSCAVESGTCPQPWHFFPSYVVCTIRETTGNIRARSSYSLGVILLTVCPYRVGKAHLISKKNTTGIEQNGFKK